MLMFTKVFADQHSSSQSTSSECTLSDSLKYERPKEKTYIFWILFSIVLIIAVTNLVLSISIFRVLRLGSGIGNIEFYENDKILQTFGDTELKQVLQQNTGEIYTLPGDSMKIMSKQDPILWKVGDKHDVTWTKLKIDPNQVLMKEVEYFQVNDPKTKNKIFSTNFDTLKVPKDVETLNAKKIYAGRITSSEELPLQIKSDKYARLRGNEGAVVRGKSIKWISDGDIYLKSVNGGLYFTSEYLKINAKDMPTTFGRSGRRRNSQFKLCLCMPKGILFKVLIPKTVQPHLACSLAIAETICE